MPQAKTLQQAIDNLKYEPLQKAELKEFYIETAEVRGGDEACPQLKRELLQNKLESLRYLVAGSRGCGKSTELNRLQDKLEPVFLVVSFSVNDELDLFHFTPIDLLIVTMKKIFEAANDNGIEVSENFLKPIVNWVRKITTDETITKSFGGDASAGGSFKIGFLNLFNAFTCLASNAKYHDEYTKSIYKEEEPLFAELVSSSNILIIEIKEALRKDDRGLLVIIEDLDKMDVRNAEVLFFDYNKRLTALKVNSIFTFPISLCYHSRSNIAVQSVEGRLFILPIIKTHQVNGDPLLERGQYVLRELLLKRMNASLFESEALMMNFIRYSGGVIFDLFRFIRGAINFALNRNREKITEEDWTKAFYRGIDNYRAMISDRVENDVVVVHAKEYFDALVLIAHDSNKQPNNTMQELELRQNLCLLSYNDKGWMDVHPFVKEILIEKKLLDEKFRIK